MSLWLKNTKLEFPFGSMAMRCYCSATYIRVEESIKPFIFSGVLFYCISLYFYQTFDKVYQLLKIDRLPINRGF